MMNCDNCLMKCKADCCSVVPIPARLLDTHEVIRPILKLFPASDVMGEPYVVPLTKDGKCPFLGWDNKCSIYEDRPPICRKFGDETSPFMTCTFQAADGRIRSRQERRHLERTLQGQQEATINRLREGSATDKDKKTMIEFIDDMGLPRPEGYEKLP